MIKYMLRRTLPSSDPSIRRSAPPPTPSQEQMAEWEAKLAGEGMGVEAGEGVDKGAEALKREKLEEKYGKAVKDIQNEMLYYWLSRSPLSTWGDHKQAVWLCLLLDRKQRRDSLFQNSQNNFQVTHTKFLMH